jgi:hypothetical protein
MTKLMKKKKKRFFDKPSLSYIRDEYDPILQETEKKFGNLLKYLYTLQDQERTKHENLWMQ